MATPNALIHETSPYLLQHAHNPVQWQPWGQAALDEAQRTNKLLLISVGYAACHWCHVMERECFEDAEVAALMNARFVNIKVDREERPDVDAVYMEAVQLMRQRGGWPLNVLALPDGRPLYGGTYFPKAQWMDILTQVSDLWTNDPPKATSYAENLTEAMQAIGPAPADPTNGTPTPTLEDATRAYIPLAQTFDLRRGGPDRAPKFPLPGLWHWVLRFHHATHHPQAQEALAVTLRAMAQGGLYDHVGGGFARYSTDAYWFLPHFEKMLYDNGQLVSLYADAHRHQPDPLYAETLRQTLDWVAREMTHPEGGFYASLDADSEGEEGKFYVWTLPELEQLLAPEDLQLATLAYNTQEKGNWEGGQNILYRTQTDAELAQLLNRPQEQVAQALARVRQTLLQARAQRVRPGLDDKILASWNALMTRGYVDAYRALGEPAWLEAAQRNAAFVQAKLGRPDGGLYRTWKDGRAHIPAFLEDYAYWADAHLALYQATFDDEHLRRAQALVEYALQHFDLPGQALLAFTPQDGDQLITRKPDTSDNVQPSANAVLAHTLWQLSRLLDRPEWDARARHMLHAVWDETLQNAGFMHRWATLMLDLALPQVEAVCTGPGALAAKQALDAHYRPHLLWAGHTTAEPFAILQGRVDPAQTRLYLCQDRACGLPVTEPAELLRQLDRMPLAPED